MEKNKRIMPRTSIFLILIILNSAILFAESFNIENMGLSQIGTTNQDYTLSRTVVLNLNISSNATECRYANEDLNYYIWESCTPIKYWLLTSGVGGKTVYVQINHTNSITTTYNDSIYYDYTGAGLDTTPPGNVTIIADNYTKDNGTITAKWTASVDPESDILEIPVAYEYRIQLNGAYDNSWTSVTERELSYDINTSDEDNVTISIRTTNSAGLQTINNKTIHIDLTIPSTPTITGNYNETDWHNTNTVTFNWSANDNNGILGYSYTLSQNSGILPDGTPEGPKGSTQSHLNKTFNTNNDGIYYLRIRAIDLATNPSLVGSYMVMIDNTAPKKPVMTQATQYVSTSTVNFTWTHSEDISGTEHYEIQVSNSSGFASILNTTNTTEKYAAFNLLAQGTYYARVRVKNGAGINSIWSNEKEKDFDSTPPIITLISPQDLAGDDISNDYPRVIIKTDEKAVCYNQDSNKEFTFTNSTYHETRIKIVDGITSLNILCADENNNSDTLSEGPLDVIFSSFSVSAPTANITYVNTLTKINLTLDTPLYGYERDDFNATLNGSTISFNIIPTQDPAKYTFVFLSPKEEGTYSLQINNLPMSLTVQKINTIIEYIDTNLTQGTTTTQTAYGELNNRKIGILTEDKDNILEANDNNNLTLISDSDTKKLIFFTRKVSNLKQKENELYGGEFFNRKYAAINAYSAKPNIKKIIIDNPEISINTTKEFGKGILNLKITLLRISNGNKIITIEENEDQQKDKTVYS